MLGELEQVDIVALEFREKVPLHFLLLMEIKETVAGSLSEGVREVFLVLDGTLAPDIHVLGIISVSIEESELVQRIGLAMCGDNLAQISAHQFVRIHASIGHALRHLDTP